VSYRLFVHPLARLDILDAVVWYEEQRPGLGLEVSDQVDAATRRAADNPLAFSIVEGTTRRVPCRRFPYAVFFELNGDRLVVLAVTHVRRDPITWRSRTSPGPP
jgi:plasmid stabilization system protein ParE